MGNLPLNVTENELRHEFLPFGEVLSVTIMSDQYIGSGQMHGYGFVEMASKSGANAAIGNLTGKTIKGKVVTVVEALPLSNMGNIHSKRVTRFSRNDRVRSY